MPRRYEPVRRKNSLIASAEVLAATSVGEHKVGSVQPWMEQAWQFYDTIGELRFGTNWYSNALSRINIVAAAPPSRQGDEPQVIDLQDEMRSGEDWYTPGQKRAVELIEFIAGGVHGQGQMMGAFGLYLSLVGLSYLLAEPSMEDPTADSYETWNVLCNEELRVQRGSQRLEVRSSAGEWRPVHPNALVVKVWTQHPRYPWLPDAPVKGVLGILRTISLLQAHIDASAESRLSGAGLLLWPDEASMPNTLPGIGNDPESQEEDLTEALIRVSSVAIQNPSSPAARIPVIASMPGEWIDKAKHLRFDTAFDDRVESLLDKSIRRLALGLDMPPEILTGVGGMNHWSAWQVEETALTLHIEPLAETVCHALTVGYLRQALEQEGFDPDEAIVWYDSSDLRTRPDRSTLAREAWDRMTISTSALLREQGLSEDDLIDAEEKRERTLLSVATAVPDLAPEILQILGYLTPQQASQMNGGTAAPAGGGPTVTDSPAPTVNGPPERPAGSPPESPEPTASLEPLIAACDMLVVRALERAGARLLSTANAKKIRHSLRDIPVQDRYMSTDSHGLASVGSLLEGALDYLPAIASRYGANEQALTAILQTYCTELISNKEPHGFNGLAERLRSQLPPASN